MTALRICVDCHGDELERGECYVTRFDFEDTDVHHGPDCHLHHDDDCPVLANDLLEYHWPSPGAVTER